MKRTIRLTGVLVLVAALVWSLPLTSVQAASARNQAEAERATMLDSSAAQPDAPVEAEAQAPPTAPTAQADIPQAVVAKAAAQGKTVVREVPGLRDANSRHYLLSDGSYAASITMGEQNYRDDTGAWQPIQTRLVDEADLNSMNIPLSQASSAELKSIMQSNMELRKGQRIDKASTDFRAPQVPFDVKIPKNINKGYSIGKGAEQLSFRPLDVHSVTGAVYGNSVHYLEAWTQTDLQLEVLDIGLKETIVLKNNQAPTTFRFQVTGGDIRHTTSLSLQAPWLIDAAGTKRDVKQTISNVNGEQIVELAIDPAGLQYPITIDPTVLTKNASQDATCATNSNCFSTSAYTYYLYLGANNSSSTNYLFIQFDTSSIPANSIINSAAMKLYINAGYRDHSYPGLSYFVTSPWDQNSLTLQNMPTYSTTNPIPFETGSYGTVINSVDKPGWMQVDVKPHLQAWVSGTANNGMMLQLTDWDQSNKYILSSEYPDASYRPQLVVNYESSPLQPIVLSPNGGETIDSTYTMTWSPATDPDTVQAQLKYQVQLSQDGGANWSDLLALSAEGQSQLSYDFSAHPNSTHNLIRVRAYDGVQYGPWDTSNEVFTIQHNQAPNAPYGLNPGSTSSSGPTLIFGSPTLNWYFSDADAGDKQSAYQIQLFNGTTIVHDTNWVASSLTAYTVPAGTLSRNTAYNWKVRTKDKAGAISAFSELGYVKINSLPHASLTSYTDGQQLADNVLTFTWTYSDMDGQAQFSYQILGSQDNWATTAYNSGVVNGAAASWTTVPLASGNWSFKLMVSDGMEWSNAVYRSNLQLPNAFEPNNTSAQAFQINYNQTYSSFINSSSDVDFFKFTAAANEIDRLILNVPAGLNYDVYIYDSSMKLITAGVQAAGVTENELFDVKAGNVYYIKIVGVGGNSSASLTYNFVLAPATLQFQTSYQYDSNGNIILKTTTTVS